MFHQKLSLIRSVREKGSTNFDLPLGVPDFCNLVPEVTLTVDQIRLHITGGQCRPLSHRIHTVLFQCQCEF